MLLQLCLEIRPPNPPPLAPNSQVIKMEIRTNPPPSPVTTKYKIAPTRRYIGGLMPSTTAIKGCYSSCAWRSDPLTPPLPPPNSQVIKMEIRSPLPCDNKKLKKKNSSAQEIYRRPDAKHNRHQRMLLQLCLEIRPPIPPPPRQRQEI